MLHDLILHVLVHFIIQWERPHRSKDILSLDQFPYKQTVKRWECCSKIQIFLRIIKLPHGYQTITKIDSSSTTFAISEYIWNAHLYRNIKNGVLKPTYECQSCATFAFLDCDTCNWSYAHVGQLSSRLCIRVHYKIWNRNIQWCQLGQKTWRPLSMKIRES